MPRKKTSVESTSGSDDLIDRDSAAMRLGSREKGSFGNLFTLGLILVILVCAVILWLKQSISPHVEPSQQKPPTPSVEVRTDPGATALVALVAKHIVVDQDEIPTITKLDDVASLRQQDPDFYRDAQKNDLLFVWKDQIVLYSVAKDLVLGVIPLNSPDEQPTKEEATIEVRNGAGKAGVAKRTADSLSGLGLQVLAPANAAKNDYPLTLVVQLSDKDLPKTRSILLENLAVSDVTTTLPEYEKTSSADFVIILGADAVGR